MAKARLKGKQPKLPLAVRKTKHRRYHDPDDDASLDDLAAEYSVGRSTIHRIISSTTSPPDLTFAPLRLTPRHHPALNRTPAARRRRWSSQLRYFRAITTGTQSSDAAGLLRCRPGATEPHYSTRAREMHSRAMAAISMMSISSLRPAA
ncbi:hypothetical protein [Nocardia gipuzkoensis]|uniref:hypothetical protein n=1 Tax=Nocardia gipuzkoensis TaxID=2749991 RepID=UPI00237D5A49|nr:hypothetical protein [Nocardia gipuzkoensis]MDE1674315.1 hypothetical protein [Nocardia gipuzkoensis]